MRSCCSVISGALFLEPFISGAALFISGAALLFLEPPFFRLLLDRDVGERLLGSQNPRDFIKDLL